jgi:hypothetical protein
VAGVSELEGVSELDGVCELDEVPDPPFEVPALEETTDEVAESKFQLSCPIFLMALSKP